MITEPTAMCLSTCSRSFCSPPIKDTNDKEAACFLPHQPSSRMVLLKRVDYPSCRKSDRVDPHCIETRGGLVWFSNYESNKGIQLEKNPWAALNFWWSALDRQIRIQGHVHKLPMEESDGYFAMRPQGSQYLKNIRSVVIITINDYSLI